MKDLPIPYLHGVAVRLRAKGPFLKEKLGEALASDNYAEVEHFANLLTAGQDAADLIERASPGTLQFWVSKLLLDEAFEACTRDHNERIAVLTGFRVENVAIPTRVVVPDHDSRSFVAASADPTSVHELVVQGYDHSHHVMIVMHGHPGKGQAANCPSGTDMRTQELWEETGDVISGIFSRDGWVRFFSKQLDFRLVIGGREVKWHGIHEIKLDV